MSSLPSHCPDEIREHLSAWHDGALEPEPARFLQRRLDADDALRESLGRWQMLGDVLRGVPSAAAAPGFAEAVFARLDAEAPMRQIAQGSGRAINVRWWGAGLAAGLGALLLLPLASKDAGQSPVAASERSANLVASVSLPDQPRSRSARVSVPLMWPAVEGRIASAVPPLVRAPQPSAAQLAPLPAVEVSSRQWPRSGASDLGFTVSYRIGHGNENHTQQ